MASILKKEISISVQFLLIVFVALVLAFFGMLPGGGSDGEYAIQINISEAWKNEAPYVRTVILIFSVLSVLRLAVIVLAHSFKKSIR